MIFFAFSDVTYASDLGWLKQLVYYLHSDTGWFDNQKVSYYLKKKEILIKPPEIHSILEACVLTTCILQSLKILVVY